VSHHDGTVTIQAGSWGTAPVYLAVGKRALWGTWDPGELLRRLSNHGIDPVLAVAFLSADGIPYSARTLIPGLSLLTAGAQARWRPTQPDDVEIIYPPPALRPRPRRVKDGADVPGAFVNQLRNVMRRWVGDDAPAFCHLSGGLDSAIVAAVASMLTPDVRTFGLELDGAMGAAQFERRQAMTHRFGWSDHAFAAGDHAPFGWRGFEHRRDRPFAWSECYLEGFGALLEEMRQQHGDIVLSGIGGDELCLPRWDEMSDVEQAREQRAAEADRVPPDFVSLPALRHYEEARDSLDCAPPSLVATSVLQGATTSAPLHLRLGVWPANPLSSSEVVQFCLSLPRDWRDNRRIERETLTRWGLPVSVTHPSVVESFQPLMMETLRREARPWLAALFAKPALADLGIVDGRRLAQAYDAFCRGERNDEWSFYAAAMLEMMVRSVHGCDPAAIRPCHR
jgi:asparagine synthase (glutamine-hydrolysing)